MIILGEKYTFTKLELEKLRKKFGQVIFYPLKIATLKLFEAR